MLAAVRCSRAVRRFSSEAQQTFAYARLQCSPRGAISKWPAQECKAAVTFPGLYRTASRTCVCSACGSSPRRAGWRSGGPLPPTGRWGHGWRDTGGPGPRELCAAAITTAPATGRIEDVILLDVAGMKCGGCVSRVRRVLQEHSFVSGASVNLATETALVRVEIRAMEELMSKGEMLAQALTGAGFAAKMRDPAAGAAAAAATAHRKREERQERLAAVTRNLAVAWLLAGTCLAGHMLHCWPGIFTAPPVLRFLASTELHAVLSVVTLLGPGREILTDGLAAMARGRPDMNTLVSLGAVSALGVSVAAVALPQLGWRAFFEEPAMLLGVVLLGRALEGRAKLQASADMVALYSLLPSKARLVLGHGSGSPSTRDVPADAISKGDIIQVLPGDRVPVDGVVLGGRTTVDESALTGEPMPVVKEAESEVTAGTINVDGIITVESRASGGDTVIADIVRSVESAQARTAPVQRVADNIAGQFSYAVMGLSVATFGFWLKVGTSIFPQVLSASYSASPLLLSLQLACNVLVVACPCALGLATPTAVLVGTSAAAKQRLLIRGGDVLENLAGVDTVVFDKTGTLTEGLPRVLVVEGVHEGLARERVLALAAGAEEASRHPLARAIVAAGDEEALPRLRAEEGSVQQEPGSGIAAQVDGHSVLVGTRAWLLQHGCTSPPAAGAAPPPGATRVFVAVDGGAAGHIDLVDTVRPGAADTVRALKAKGLRTIMLSGDQAHAAHEVARQLGLDAGDVYAGVKPEGKLAKVQELMEGGARVAMVGDGINDTAALAAADVGMAMSGGVQAAGDVADVLLLSDKPEQVLDAISLSQATLSKIRQNLAWAFGYNLIGIPIAAGALLPGFGIALTPSISGALMGVSSLAVMTNSLLLRPQVLQEEPAPALPATPGSVTV